MIAGIIVSFSMQTNSVGEAYFQVNKIYSIIKRSIFQKQMWDKLYRVQPIHVIANCNCKNNDKLGQ